MKKSILFIAVLAFTFISTTNLTAQEFSKMDVSPMDAAAFPSYWKESNKLVKVIYSRPQLKGRELSKLAPNDKVWRTGANESAEITFYKDVLFGGKKVKAGTYSLFTIPTDEDWTVIVSNHKNIWGSYFYKKELDVIRTKGKASVSEQNIEAFSIVFDKNKEENIFMHLGWGNKIISVSIKEITKQN